MIQRVVRRNAIAEAIIGRASRIEVVAGAFDHDPHGIVLATESDHASIGELVSALDSFDEGAMDWLSWGEPSIVFWGDDVPLAVVVCVLPEWVRCDLWSEGGYYELRDPTALAAWFASQGLHDLPT